MEIFYTIRDGNCGECTEDDVQSYADAVERAIRRRYHRADVTVEVEWGTTGRSGFGVTGSKDDQRTAEAVDALAQEVWASGTW